mmetsp:Transcript_108258/g.171114  ORF Transcript_108258/g.171114 Transcript_108258/m.171114 type:complete len:678 (+) Transcript_108258:62-2095(+)
MGSAHVGVGLRCTLTFLAVGPVSVAPTPPQFYDFDCELVNVDEGAIADWNAIYGWVEQTVIKAKRNETSFVLRPELRYLLSGEAEAAAKEECPIGLLYVRTLAFYEELFDGTTGAELMEFANGVQSLLQSFPVYAIALSRWPVFYALEHFSYAHIDDKEWDCEGQQGVLDWGDLRRFANEWAHLKTNGLGVDDGTLERMEYTVADMFFKILRYPANQYAAQGECEYGFYFLTANQVVAAAGRESQHLQPFNVVLDAMMERTPFTRLAATGWPILTVLAILTDLNKGVWFFGGDRKYLRGFSDWNLRREELAPLVPSSYAFLSDEWKSVASEQVEEFLRLPKDDYVQRVEALVAQREQEQAPLRPIVANLISAALSVVAAQPDEANADGTRQRLTYVVLLYGNGWARLLERLAVRLHHQLKVLFPVLVVAIGVDAAEACEKLSAEHHGESLTQRVICWTPGVQSQVHRFTIVNGLLHMGIDVIYVDMDTFMVQDPTPRILAQAEGRDALFARHADADCINIGVFFLRAGRRTAIWMSQFLAWYHDYPYEVDQRGLHVFLKLPAEKLKVGYPPKDLVDVRSAVLEDVNEIVIGDVGWHGMYSRMLIFHWCHRPLALKVEEIRDAYDAADALENFGIPVSLALEVVLGAIPENAWEKVLRLKSIFENYRKDAPPERTPCW